MIISISGPHSTGKTTLINELKKKKFFKDYVVVQNITRGLKERGFKINEDGDDSTQIGVLSSQLMCLSYKNALLDRCLLDGYCYTKYLYKKGSVSEKIFNLAHNLLLNSYFKYDVIFYLPVEFDIVNDGVRSTDKKFQKDIDIIFKDTIQMLNKIDNKIIKISGDINKRVEKILNFLEVINE